MAKTTNKQEEVSVDVDVDLVDSSAEVEALKAKVSELESKNVKLGTVIADLEAANKQLTKKLEKAEAKKVEKADGVVLNGVDHEVTHKERMYDLVDMWRKRFVTDDDTVLVIKKK